MKTIPLQLLFIFSLFSCAYISQDEGGKTKIRAIVVNPKKSNLYISKDFFQQDADTLVLSSANEATKTIDVSKEGLYVLHIFPEYQTIYLKPNDSLSIHINIDEFDESLSFSGGLGFENNLLVELFLINEKQSEFYFKKRNIISKKQLLKQIDSFTIIKNQVLNDYKNELSKTTKKFKEIVELYTDITTYSIKENYISNHSNEEFSNRFLSHRSLLRKTIVDHRVIDLFTFVDAYFRNVIPEENRGREEMHQLLIDNCNKKIFDKDFRSIVLMRYCYGYISNYRISKEDTVVKEYFSVIKSDKSKKYCKKLINKNRKLFKNKKFPSVELIDKNGKTMLSDSLMKDKRTIVSFWDLYRKKSFNSNLEKLLNLSKNYPKIQIVLLNRNYDEHEVWRRTIPKQTNVVFYQLKNKKDVMLLMPYSLAQTFLLKNDTIKGSMLNLYNVTFEKEFKQFAAQK